MVLMAYKQRKIMKKKILNSVNELDKDTLGFQTKL